jgi:hydroxyacylglutathione hydrolase
MALRYETLVTGSFVENGYVLWDDDRSDCILIDPGAEPERWTTWLDDKELRPVRILATHCHLDHVGAVAALQQEYDCPFSIHTDEREMLDALPVQTRMFGHPSIDMPHNIHHLGDEETIDDAGFDLHTIPTPGHTPGGMSYHAPGLGRVFTGDTLFAGSIGRTDLPGGDHDLLLRSLRGLVLRLDDATVVCPGHGPESTIHQERTSNPFFRVER